MEDRVEILEYANYGDHRLLLELYKRTYANIDNTKDITLQELASLLIDNKPIVREDSVKVRKGVWIKITLDTTYQKWYNMYYQMKRSEIL